MVFTDVKRKNFDAFLTATRNKQEPQRGEIWPLSLTATSQKTARIYFTVPGPTDTYFAFVEQDNQVVIAQACLVEGRAQCVQANELRVTHSGPARIYFIAARKPFLPEEGFGNSGEDVLAHILENAENYWIHTVSN